MAARASDGRRSKRPREEFVSNSTLSNALKSNDSEFTFGFGRDEEDEENTQDNTSSSKKQRITAHMPDSKIDKDLDFTPTPVCACFKDGTGIFGMHSKYIDIDFQNSTESSLSARECAHKKTNGNTKNLSSSRLFSSSIIRTIYPGLRSKTLVKDDIIWSYDSVFPSDSFPRDSKEHHFSQLPLTLEAGLESYAWPLRPETFRQKIFDKKAFVVQGSGGRLHALKTDFHDFDIKSLLFKASKVVVWMKDMDGKMNYLEANPEVGWSCLCAGHSLYFNPDIETQRKYLLALCEDLEMEWGLRLDPQASDFGGDLEIFAVFGDHETPWHFDAQHNFTVQLKGFKKWTVSPSGITNPMTNLHPSSTNTTTYQNNLKVHNSYVSRKLCSSAEDENLLHRSFILRPGSIAYVPAGWWHKVSTVPVTSVGLARKDSRTTKASRKHPPLSLSINFSIDGGRWSDLLLSRLKCLVQQNSNLRCRVQGNVRSARETFEKSLLYFKKEVSKLTVQHFLPEGLLEKNENDAGLKVMVLTGKCLKEQYPHHSYHSRVKESMIITRNPLYTLTCVETNKTKFKFSLRAGFGSRPDFFTDFEKEFVVDSDIGRIMKSRLCHLKPWEQLHVCELAEYAKENEREIQEGEALWNDVVDVVAALMFYGYFVVGKDTAGEN